MTAVRAELAWEQHQYRTTDGIQDVVQMADYETPIRVHSAMVARSASQPGRWLLSLTDEGLSYHDTEELAKAAAVKHFSTL